MADLCIRPGQPGDAASIADFNCRMCLETEHHELDRPTVEAGVIAVFDSPSRGRYFVAEQGDEVVGCLMITHEWSDWRNGDVWWIQSVYVVPAARRKGVFRAMYKAVESAAKEAGAVGIRLYVERENTTAQSTYVSLGMSETHYRMMEVMFG